MKIETRYTTVDYEKRVCLAMNFISQNLERDLPLEEIASAAAFSPFHFHRIFKAMVGETVGAFTRRLRLELAANRLISRVSDDITTIAIDCGFSSSQNFAKAFRQLFGQTPSEFRNSKIGNTNRKNETALSLRSIQNGIVVLNNTFNLKRRVDMNVEIKEFPASQVAYFRTLGSYSTENCAPAFAQLMGWAGPRGLIGPGAIVGIYWDNPEVTSLEKCRFDACVILPESFNPGDQINTQVLRGGPYAACRFEVPPDQIQEAWDEAISWLCESGYESDDFPCLEIYQNNATEHPEGKWIFDICIPIKRG